MQHLPILPILLPLFGALVLVLFDGRDKPWTQRIISSLFLLAALAASLVLLKSSLLETQLYVLGDWQPPFGISLVADPLSALLVTLTCFLALACLLASFGGHDQGGLFYHPLFLFQITGINGAFLTGDIFNLFVFFEILLIASYSLLIHGGGKEKTQAGFHYVSLNLLASAFFLFALGIIYGTLGTLNMADLAMKAKDLHADDLQLASAGVLLLVVVFGLKAAILPLHFWLNKTYGSAVAPIAALFAIMTKVGVYSMYRVHVQVFGDYAGELANLAQPWLWTMGLATLIVGGIGALAAHKLRDLAGWLVIVSVGTLVVTVSLNSPKATAAGLYYLIHSTLVTAALYLIADLISVQRGQAGDRFVSARPMAQSTLLSAFFLIAALVVVGLPPLSGFLGKVAVMQAAETASQQAWFWSCLLIASLASLIAVARGGTTLFWRIRGNRPGDEPLCPWQVSAVVLLLAASPLLVIFAQDMLNITQLAADILHAEPTGVPMP